jgi:DNA-binding XRE family transcriptional regulator
MMIKTTKSKLNKSELAKSIGISRSSLYYNSKKDIIYTNPHKYWTLQGVEI